MKYRRLLFFYCLALGINVAMAQSADLPFAQPVSFKYHLHESVAGATLKKIAVDYNDIIYVLSDKGLLRLSEGELIKDNRYTPLQQKIPIDIAVQEGEKNLYYLYSDKVLTNAHAGTFYANLPSGKFSMLAVAADMSILLAGKKGVAFLKGKALTDIPAPAGKIISVYSSSGIFYLLTNEALYKLSDNHFEKLHAGKDIKSVCFRNDEIILATSNGYYGISSITADTTFPLQIKLPVTNIDFLTTINNNIWAATSQGAFMHEPVGIYRYYASQRWLIEDKVIEIASDSKANAYMLTASGVSKVEFFYHTLANKAQYFQDKIRQRHIRYGFIANVTLEKAGDLSTARMTDTDNDGLWTAFYLGSQAFRYAVTKDKEAKRYAWEAFEAYERILSVNPLKGFPARTFERKGFKYSDPERWHASQDPEWEWKGTTSSDEFVAYIWVASVLHEMVAETESEKKRVEDFIDKIMNHIISNNYYFIDMDGKPTLWGRWNPEYINSFPETVGDRKLGSTTIIAGLQLAYDLTGKEVYKTEADKLMNEYGYLKNMLVSYKKIGHTPGTLHMGIDLGDGGWNHSDDEMAFLTYWVLYRHAFTPELQQQYASIIRDHWQIEQPERNALWNLISLGTCKSFDEASAFWHLREFPMDLIRWNMKNSHRKDIELLPSNFRKQLTKDLLSPEETPLQRHNSNAFVLDGGEGGKTELAGDEYLLPYWMARYLRVIE